MTEEPGRLQSMGLLRVGHQWATSLSRIGEGNGNPLQCSCLENPRDRGAWWAAISGVAQSQTRLKWLSSSSSSSSIHDIFASLTWIIEILIFLNVFSIKSLLILHLLSVVMLFYWVYCSQHPDKLQNNDLGCVLLNVQSDRQIQMDECVLHKDKSALFNQCLFDPCKMSINVSRIPSALSSMWSQPHF